MDRVQEPIRVMIYTAMWRRHELSQLWSRQIQEFIAAAPPEVDVKVFAVVSGDTPAKICSDHGFNFLRYKNFPIGEKWNAGLRHLVEHHRWDYLLIMGDDDFINARAWDAYMPMLHDRVPYFGFSNIYFYNINTRQALHFDYAAQGKPRKLIGCGRMVSHEAVMRAGVYQDVRVVARQSKGLLQLKPGDRLALPMYQAAYLAMMDRVELIQEPYFQFWHPALERGLDNDSEVGLLMAGYEPEVIRVATPLIVDVKTRHNLWAFERFEHCSKVVCAQKALAGIPPHVRKDLVFAKD